MEVGPVDVVIIGFPGNKFTGRIAPAIMELVEAGTIRVLDLLFVMKDADGAVDDRSRPRTSTRTRGRPSWRSTSPSRARWAPRTPRRSATTCRPNTSALLHRVRERLGARRSSRPSRRRTRVLIDQIRIPADVVEAPWPRARTRPLRPNREVLIWDSCAWQPAPPSSRAPRPPCPGGSLAVRRRSTTAAGRRPAVRRARAARRSARTAEQDADRQAPEARAAAHPGRADRRGVRGRQGQGPRDLTRSRPRLPVSGVEAYARLAGVYDEIVVDPCHGRWAAFLHELWAADPTGGAHRPRRLLRHRAHGRRADRARLSGRRRGRLGGDARPRPPAARPGRGPGPGNAPRPDGRRGLRRRGLHLRRPELPHAGRAARDPGGPGGVGSGPAAGSSSTCTRTR